MPSDDLVLLVLERVRDLGQEMFTLYQDMSKWREPKYTAQEVTMIGVRIERCLTDQHKWIAALEREIEKA